MGRSVGVRVRVGVAVRVGVDVSVGVAELVGVIRGGAVGLDVGTAVGSCSATTSITTGGGAGVGVGGVVGSQPMTSIRTAIAVSEMKQRACIAAPFRFNAGSSIHYSQARFTAQTCNSLHHTYYCKSML